MVQIHQDAETKLYYALNDQLPGIVGVGPTPEEALKDLNERLAAIIAAIQRLTSR